MSSQSRGHRGTMKVLITLLLMSPLVASCGPVVPEAGKSTPPPGAGNDWRAPGGGPNKTHFSRLEDINRANVNRLGLAWSYDLGSNRGQEATPVVADGILYTSGNLGRVYALDAASGEELWQFYPQVDMQVNRVACCDQVNRGVAMANGKIFVAALDGVLYALDKRNGKIAWQVDTIVDHNRGYSSTGAPEVAGDLVIIGNGGSEYDVRGYVSAYHVADGSLAWRFYTIPKDPKLGPQENEDLQRALTTWSENSRWDIGGGGTVWDSIVYDSRFDQIYLGVGNGGPYSHAVRSEGKGDNLYLSSIVALDRRSGKLKWHYQETPRDSWDFTASQPMVLADLEIEGEQRPVIIHAPKNGFIYVVDRETGKPHAANALVRTSWTDGYDLKTGKPNLTPGGSEYSTGPKIVFPSTVGATNWFPPAYDPEKGIFYASVIDMGNLVYQRPGKLDHRQKALNIGTSLIFTADLEAFLPLLPPEMGEAVKELPQMQWVRQKPYSSELRAIDPLSGKTLWAVDKAGWQDRCGVLATRSGLLFHGSVTGHFYVRDADNGEVLKSIDTGSSILAAPMSYKIGKDQYVAVAAGWGGGGWPYVPEYSAAYKYENSARILVFKLDGGAVEKPRPRPPLEVAPEAPAQAQGVTPATLARGADIFFSNCGMCHANKSRSISPDLRRMTPAVHGMFNKIVLDGILVPAGMPRWNDLLSQEDAQAVHAYLIDLQAKLHVKEKALKAAGKPLDTRAATILSNY